jgi:broad specificity phosphatase PhoE
MLLRKPFYFLRHGETAHNRNRLCAGSQTDLPLNKAGKRQAKVLRDKINALSVQKVICSPLKRAVQTAKLATPLPFVLEDDIRECHLGDFEGSPLPKFIKHYEAISSDMPFPNGESRLEVATRTLAVVNKFLSGHGENLLFVSHGIVYWSLLERLGIPFQYIENAEIVCFKPQKDTWVAEKV